MAKTPSKNGKVGELCVGSTVDEEGLRGEMRAAKHEFKLLFTSDRTKRFTLDFDPEVLIDYTRYIQFSRKRYIYSDHTISIIAKPTSSPFPSLQLLRRSVIIHMTDNLSVSNQASLRSVIRVSVSPSKSQLGIPRISRTLIPRPQCRNLRLRRRSRVLRSLVRTTDVRQLVMDAVRDDVRVERLFLALVDERIDGLKGEFRGGAAVEPGFEFDRRDAETEVQTRDAGGDEAAEVAGYGVGYCAGADSGGGAEEGGTRAGAGSCSSGCCRRGSGGG
jgi:hypothetical protein